MISILGEIAKLRKEKPIAIDYKNNNRYRVVVQEQNGTKTAYYFSAPIYNVTTKKVVDLKFKDKGIVACAFGSNTEIQISDEVYMETAESYCRMSLNNAVSKINDHEVQCGKDTLLLTTNGVAYKAYIKEKSNVSFELEVGVPFMNVTVNEKCFCFMREQFRPFMTVSCIGTVNGRGEVIAPARIMCQQTDDRKYVFTITPCSPIGEHVMFEVNLYEEKLFQDTTVESFNPKTNNAFGSTAFIGNTAEYGEQWLYSRPDFMKMQELMDKQIQRAVLYLPKYNHSQVELSAYNVAARFCSFGSNWENKIAISTAIADSNAILHYHALDVTSLISDDRTKFFKNSEGFILKSKVKGSGFAAIATGDSYFAPQILEINYK